MGYGNYDRVSNDGRYLGYDDNDLDRTYWHDRDGNCVGYTDKPGRNDEDSRPIEDWER